MRERFRNVLHRSVCFHGFRRKRIGMARPALGQHTLLGRKGIGTARSAKEPSVIAKRETHWNDKFQRRPTCTCCAGNALEWQDYCSPDRKVGDSKVDKFAARASKLQLLSTKSQLLSRNEYAQSTFAAGARKSVLLSTKIVCEVRFAAGAQKSQL